MDMADSAVIKQHLIDPEICIRCNTCETICPVKAITHDSQQLRRRRRDLQPVHGLHLALPHRQHRQLAHDAARAGLQPARSSCGWEALPAELSAEQLAEAGVEPGTQAERRAAGAAAAGCRCGGESAFHSAACGATLPPWSAAHAYTNLYGPKAAEKTITATVAGNVRVTEVGKDYDTHHIVLDFGTMPFPVLEGQSIGIVPPGVDADGRPHHPRQYSIASPRNGERPGYNNLSLTIKRVLEDHQGKPVRGVASNYLCDLKVGDKVQVIGPFGASFLMPNHPKSHIVMICTGTGSAPMRAMTEWRRRLRQFRQVRGRQADAVLRRAHEGRTAVLRPAAKPAQGLHRHQLRLQPHAGPAEDIRAGRDARARRRPGRAAGRPQRLLLCLRPEGMEEGVVLALQRHRRRAPA